MKKSKIITLFVLAIVIILATVIYLFIENSKYYTLHTAILEIDLNMNIVIVEDKIRQYNGRFEKYIFSATQKPSHPSNTRQPFPAHINVPPKPLKCERH